MLRRIGLSLVVLMMPAVAMAHPPGNAAVMHALFGVTGLLLLAANFGSAYGLWQLIRMWFFAALAVLMVAAPAIAFAQDATVEGAIDAGIAAYQTGGFWALAGSLVASLVAIYRSGWFSAKLHPTARWESWPRWAKSVASVLAGGLPPLLFGISLGLEWSQILTNVVSAVTAGMATGAGLKTAANPTAKSAPA